MHSLIAKSTAHLSSSSAADTEPLRRQKGRYAGVRKVAEEALSALHQAGFEEDYDPFAED